MIENLIQMNIFVIGFIVSSLLCALLFLYSRSQVQISYDEGFRKFEKTYLIVYLLAAAGDWLQGPYVYALYQSYKMTSHDIELLFVAGFGSSMLFGTVVGSIADKYGRKVNCIAYGIIYGLACITKHYNNFTILLVGRLLGGIATSILFSAFESWLINEHHRRGFDPSLLGSVFSHSVVGNSVVGILSGLVAQKSADIFGFVAPFDISLIVLLIMSVIIKITWVENYGDQKSSTIQSFSHAFTAIKSDYRILCLGLIQSLFEGSMYTFILEWTPALTKDNDHMENDPIPHGLIFAGFMVCIMIGSSLFNILRSKTSIENFMRPILLISCVSISTPIFFPQNKLIIFIGFLVFEVCVGIFWPSMSSMRDKYVPETVRATLMNIFRVPLNLIVIIILTWNLPIKVIFSLCVFFLGLAFLCQQWLFRLSNRCKNHSTSSSLTATGIIQEEKTGPYDVLIEKEQQLGD